MKLALALSACVVPVAMSAQIVQIGPTAVRCAQGACNGSGAPIGLCGPSSGVYTDTSQNPVVQYSCQQISGTNFYAWGQINGPLVTGTAVTIPATTNLLKGNGLGNTVPAVPGVDYLRLSDIPSLNLDSNGYGTLATDWPGIDICQKVTNALASAPQISNTNIVFYTPSEAGALASFYVTGAPKVIIPRQASGLAWECTTSIVPPKEPRVPSTIEFAPGAIIHESGAVWTMDWSAAIYGGQIVDIINPQLAGTGAALGGIRLGPGNGQRVDNPSIVNFYSPGAAAIQFDGTDGQAVYGGQIGANYDGIQYVVTSTGPAKGTGYPNGTTVQGVHFYGNTHTNVYGAAGYGDRILDTVSDGPTNGQPAGIFTQGNNVVIQNNTVEAGANAQKCFFVGTLTAGSTLLTVKQYVVAGSNCLVPGQPLTANPGQNISTSAYVKSITGSSVDMGYPATASGDTSMNSWIQNPHVWELHNGTYQFRNNYNSDVGYHATVLADNASIAASGNKSGGDESAMIDFTNETVGINAIDVSGQTALFGYKSIIGLALSPNSAGFPVQKICSVCAPDGIDNNVLGVSPNNDGLRMNAIVGPSTGMRVTNGFAFQGGASIDAAGVYHPAANSTPYSGTCASPKAITYTNGIATGCN